MSPAPVPLPWPAFLDALEEWLRRTAEVVRSGGEQAPVLTACAEGPLPAASADRARALLQEMRRLEAVGTARRSALQRARTYAAH